MATSDIINRLQLDAFKNPQISQEELFRRLNALVEFLYLMFSQTQGNLLVNTNVTIVRESSPSGATIMRVAFNTAGETVNLTFVGGILQP
mgnify:CR=1 FL=1